MSVRRRGAHPATAPYNGGPRIASAPTTRKRFPVPLLLAFLLLLPRSVALAGAPVQILAEDAASPWSNRDGTDYANDLVGAAF